MMCFVRLMVLMLFVLTAGTVEATMIYQWKDASGHVHFTDRFSQVPKAYRHNRGREMRPVAPVSGKASTKFERPPDGKSLYQNKCAQCHVLGFKDEGRKEGLGWAIINMDTNYPKTEADLFQRLRYVVDGGIDMSIIDINDKELTAITRYLIEKSQPKGEFNF